MTRRLTLPILVLLATLATCPLGADTFQSIDFHTSSAPVQTGLLEGGPNHACNLAHPGTFRWRDGNASLTHYYEAYTFHNNGPSRCVSALLDWDGDDCGDLEIGLALYVGSFDPSDPTKNLAAAAWEGPFITHDGDHYDDYRHSPGYYRDLAQAYFLDSLSAVAEVPAGSPVIAVLSSRRRPGQPDLHCPRSAGAHLYLSTKGLAEGLPPALSVNDLSQYEYGPNAGDGGIFSFWIRLSAQSDLPVSVHYATQDGSGVAGVDYDAASGTVTFAPGETVKVVPVKIRGNTTVQPNRTLKLALSSPNPAAVTLPAAPATGTILDDDNLAGTCHIVSPTALPFGTVGKPYGPVDMTPDGKEGSDDYVWSLAAGSLPPGIALSSAENAGDSEMHGILSGTPTAAGTWPITVHLVCPELDGGSSVKDTPFSILVFPEASQIAFSLDDASVVEGNSGQKGVQPLLHLSAAAPQAQPFLVELIQGSATAADADYVPLAPGFTVNVPAGATTYSIPIQVVGDIKVEDDEKLMVVVKTPIEGKVVASGQVTIVNDDAAAPLAESVPTLSPAALAALVLCLAVAGFCVVRFRHG